MTELKQKAPWQTPSSFVGRQCRQCAAGWTRTGKEGGVLTVCLLDREPVPDITSCDRFEVREPFPNEQVLKETA